jgi:hypothetical protein
LQQQQQQPRPQATQEVAPQPASGGGLLSHFRGSRFSQAMTQGAGIGVGFGLADSVINSLFN